MSNDFLLNPPRTDVRAQTYHWGLMDAIIRDDVNTLRRMIEEDGVDCNFTFSNGFQYSLLYEAVVQKKQTIIELLLVELQANPNQKDNLRGSVPLHFLADEDDVRTLRLFLDNNADPNIQESNGYTPMHIIARNVFGNMSVNRQVSVDNSSQEMITALIQAGADRNLRDNRGRTAEEIAPAITPIIEAALPPSYNQATRPGR